MIFDLVTYDTIIAGGAPDADGITWCVSSIEGWWETPPLTQNVINPTGMHGSVIASSTLAARPLVLRGSAKADMGTDPAVVIRAFDRLGGISWPLLSSKSLTVVEQGITRTVAVKTAGAIRKRWAGPLAFIFEVPLLAEDPRKYAATVTTVDLPATVPMLGNFPSEPVLTLTAGGNYTITNTTQGAGASLFLTGVPAGTVVDMRGRSVKAGTVDYYGAVGPTSVWWTLLPGNNVITKSGGAATISWRDAWM